MKKTVVITGGTRGIGIGMAKEFLSRGHNVVITGTSEESVARGLKDIGENSNLIGVPCLVENTDSIEMVWDKAIERFKTVDVWINNAGAATSRNGLEELSYDEITRTIDTNLTGTILATRIVSSRMLKQGSGQIYMFEGFGSNGQLQKGISVYGSTKRALRYFTAAAANEFKDTPIVIGSISPGIVTTDLLLRSSKSSEKEWEKAKKILNVLADRAEVVTPWLVDEVLKNNKNGAKIAWLTTIKVLGRLIFGRLFCKKQVIDDWEREQAENHS
jgi:NAD(P)-dependent dehydrogenase (short-subunit alcohol dehydrogenase family)